MARESTEWMTRAACRGCDPSLFFPEQGSNAPYARALCAGCGVQTECLRYGLWEDEGIYGGLNARQRKQLRRGYHQRDFRQAS